MQTLLQRRSRVREGITAFRESDRNPFPNWKTSKSVALPADVQQFVM